MAIRTNRVPSEQISSSDLNTIASTINAATEQISALAQQVGLTASASQSVPGSSVLATVPPGYTHTISYATAMTVSTRSSVTSRTDISIHVYGGDASSPQPAWLRFDLGDDWARDAADQGSGQGVNIRTSSYTLTASDAHGLVEMNVSTANSLTIPSGVFGTGDSIMGRQYGAGPTAIVAGSGMTLRSRGGATASAGQYAEWTITFRSATEAVLSGDIA